MELKPTKQQYTCPMHPEIIRDEPGSCPKCGMNLVPMKKTDSGDSHSTMTTLKEHNTKEKAHQPLASQSVKDQFTCPMHPEIIRDKPGNCPVCGMTLVPLNKSESGKGQTNISNRVTDIRVNNGDQLHDQPKGKQQYTCSMHPRVIKDEPGKCPYCGMALIPQISLDERTIGLRKIIIRY